MVTFNKVVSDLCEVCGVEHDATSRVTERRGIELIRKCTEKVKVLTMGTAALATVLEGHLVEDDKAGTGEGVQIAVDDNTLPPVEDATLAEKEAVDAALANEPELVTDDKLPEDKPVEPEKPVITAPKLGK